MGAYRAPFSSGYLCPNLLDINISILNFYIILLYLILNIYLN